jgi:hypothetical protein
VRGGVEAGGSCSIASNGRKERMFISLSDFVGGGLSLRGWGACFLREGYSA